MGSKGSTKPFADKRSMNAPHGRAEGVDSRRIQQRDMRRRVGQFEGRAGPPNMQDRGMKG
jgi:hypothetical protein